VRKKNPIAALHLHPSNQDPGKISFKAFLLSFAVQFIIKQKPFLPEYMRLFEKYHWVLKTIVSLVERGRTLLASVDSFIMDLKRENRRKSPQIIVFFDSYFSNTFLLNQ
jgi:hypothetical protein